MTYRNIPFRCTAPVYLPGTVRYRRVICCEDVRLYRAAKGWSATADMLECHPITGEPFFDKDGEPDCQWWMTETRDDEWEEIP